MDFSPPPPKMGFKLGFAAAPIGFDATSQQQQQHHHAYDPDTLPSTLAGQLGHPGMVNDPRLLDSAVPVTAESLEPPPPTPIMTDPSSKHTTIALALQHQPHPRQRPQARSQVVGAHTTTPVFASTGSQRRGSQGASRVRRLKLALKVPSETYSCPHAVIYFDHGGQLRGVASDGFLRCTDRLPSATRQSLTEALRWRSSRQSLASGYTAVDVESPRRPSIAETTASITEEEDFATYPEELEPRRAGHEGRRGSRLHKPPATTQSSDSEDQDMDDSGGEDHLAAGPEVHASVEIVVGDAEAVKAFYQERFKLLQQIPCKSIAKDWIKAIEPKKQANHPYNGGKAAKVKKENGQSTVDPGELTKPEWWPPTGCPHKEPDHIDRNERMVLLLHLLRNLWDPDAKSGYKTIDSDKLMQSTKKTMEAWKTQDKYENNEDVLKEIYAMRKQEEKLIRNEIDETSTFGVKQTVAMPSRERGKRKRDLRGVAGESPAEGQLLNFGEFDARSQQSGFAQSSGTHMPPPSENGVEYNQSGRRLAMGHDGAFGALSHSPVSAMGPSEGQTALHAAQSASPTHSTGFRRGSGHGSASLYGSAGGAPQISPHSSFTSDASLGDPARPTQPLSPLRKRSVGTMNPAIAPRAGSSSSFQASGANMERQRRQQDNGYFPASSTSNQHVASAPGYPEIRPRARDAAPGSYNPPRSAGAQAPRHGLPFPPLAHEDAPSVLENNPPWAYGAMPMQSPNTGMSDMNSWGAPYSYEYNSSLTSPTQTSQVRGMMGNVQLQPQPIAAGYPYSSQQEYSMTSPRWNSYGT